MKASILASAAALTLSLSGAPAIAVAPASAPTAASAPAGGPASGPRGGRHARMKAMEQHCHDEADRKTLKGGPRADFMRECRHGNR